jgi:hypothetical protein
MWTRAVRVLVLMFLTLPVIVNRAPGATAVRGGELTDLSLTRAFTAAALATTSTGPAYAVGDMSTPKASEATKALLIPLRMEDLPRH